MSKPLSLTSGLPTTGSTNLTTDVTGTLPIANGGTNNGSLPVTAGGVVYTDGTKLVNVGAGTTGQVLTSNGASAPTWGAGSGITTAIISNQQSSGVGGGSLSAGSWFNTPLNTVDVSQSWVSLSTNQITLSAGTYQWEVTSPSYGTNHFQTRLYNVTDATVASYGSSEFNNGNTQTSSFISSVVTIGSSKTFTVDMICSTTVASYGFGVIGSFGTEVYCRITITKLA